MRTVRRNEVPFDPPARQRQPRLHQFRVMVSGIIQKNMDPSHARIHHLDRHQPPDCAEGIDRQHIFHDGLAGLQVDRAMDIEAVPPAALFHCDRQLFRRPATNRPHRVSGMHRVSEDHRLIGGKLV